MPDESSDEEPVPLFRKWNYWYILVIGVLCLVIIFFYFLTKHYS